MFFGGGFPFGFSDFEGGFPEQQQENDEPVDNTGYYELLGVEKDATTDQIKKAFKKKAIKEHPDKGGDPQKFAELSMVHDVLTDENKRKVYDKYGEKGLKQGLGNMEGGEGIDIFDLLSGNVNKQQRQKGGQRRTKDKIYALGITLEEVYQGAQKKIPITKRKLCGKCQGKGGINKEKCTECRGQGLVVKMQQIGPGMYTQATVHCSNCKGQGSIISEQDRCDECEGRGTKEEQKEFQCEIAQGTPDGYKFSYYGESDEAEDAIPGDLIVEVQVQEHAHFKRKGFDLIIKQKISLVDALTGFKIQIPFLDGKPRVITSSSGEIIQPGDIRTIKELGLPKFTTPYEFGNLFIQFDVEFPQFGAFDEQQKALIIQSLPESPNMQIELPSDPKELFPTKNFEKEDMNPYKASAGGEAYDEDEYNQAGGPVRCAPH